MTQKQRREQLLNYLKSCECNYIFKLVNQQLMVAEKNTTHWLPYAFKNNEREVNREYFKNLELEKNVYCFLCKNYHSDLKNSDVKGVIKLIPLVI